MNSRKQISKLLGVTEQYLSMLMKADRVISWPLAAKLAELFPGKSIQQWKNSTSDDLKRAFKLLDIEKAA